MVAPVLALVILLLSLGNSLQAQILQPVQAQVRPTTAAQKITRQQRRRIRHNEIGALKCLFTLNGAQATYQSTTGNGDYGTIEELFKQGLIDYVLAEGHRYGYLFRVSREKRSSESQSSYVVVAVPRSYGRTGRRSFYIDETAVVHAADKRGAAAHPGDDTLVIDP
jgi:hypothetical protein